MKQKILIIIRGAPATGKSTLAKNLSEFFKKQGKTSLLIPDEFKWVMTAHDDRKDADFNLAFSNYEYTLKNYLKAGYIVITEDTWDRAPFKAGKIVKLGKKYQYTPYQLLLTGDWEIIKHQNTLRLMKISQKQLKAQYNSIYSKKVRGEIIIDIRDKSPKQIMKEALRYILS